MVGPKSAQLAKEEVMCLNLQQARRNYLTQQDDAVFSNLNEVLSFKF